MEKMEKEGKNKISILIFLYTINFADVKVHTKFENPGSKRSTQYNLSYLMFVPHFKVLRQVVSVKSLTETFPMHNIGVKDQKKKKKMEKGGKNKISILIFLYTIYLATIKVHTKFEDLDSNRC